MSTNDGAARLTSNLLARKQAAVPSGFTPVSRHNTSAAGTPNSENPRAATQSPAAGPTRKHPAHEAVADRARVTLRLDDDRHLRLKLTAAHLDISLQELLIDALDRYLDQVSPEVLRNRCVCLGAKGEAAAG